MTLLEAKARWVGVLMRLPAVVGVGVGERGGRETIRVYVSQKIPAEELPAHHRVPREIGGYATDVIEVGEMRTQT